VLGGERSEKEEIKAIGAKAYKRAVDVLASRVGPRGLAFGLQDARASKQLAQEEAWREARIKRCEAFAKQLKLKPETHEEITDELGIPEDNDCRLQRRVADELARVRLLDAEKASRKLTDKAVEEILECWGFRQNIGRLNVMPEGQKYVYSDTVGMIRRRAAGYGLTTVTERYPHFVRFLTRWLTDNLPPRVSKEFVCTAINLNANYAGKRHRDGSNEGPSVIRAFGKFTGGRLRYWPKDVTAKGQTKPAVEALSQKDAETHDIKRQTLVFDGNRAHEVEAFAGSRYSCVFFSASGYGKAKPQDVKTLRKLGFPYPTLETMTALKRKTGCVV